MSDSPEEKRITELEAALRALVGEEDAIGLVEVGGDVLELGCRWCNGLMSNDDKLQHAPDCPIVAGRKALGEGVMDSDNPNWQAAWSQATGIIKRYERQVGSERIGKLWLAFLETDVDLRDMLRSQQLFAEYLIWQFTEISLGEGDKPE